MNQPVGLQSGPEMDAKVSEVLGWKCDFHNEEYYATVRVMCDPGFCYHTPRFSTDDGIAFIHLWPWLCERAHPILYGSRTLSDGVVQVMTNRGWEEAVEPTVALALCKAVLVVHEVAKEQR